MVALPADDTRELARLSLVMTGIARVFAAAGCSIVLATGDLASAAGTAVMVALAITLMHARRQLLRRPQRASTLLVVGILAFVLLSAPIPPPVPAVAVFPLMAVAVALSYLDGRRLTLALIAAWVVWLVAAVMIGSHRAARTCPRRSPPRSGQRGRLRHGVGRLRAVPAAPAAGARGDPRTIRQRRAPRQ